MADTDFIPFPTARPGGAPSNDYERVDVSPDTFGAAVGRATEKAGGQLRQAGSEIFQTGMEQLNLENEIKTNDLSAAATATLSNIYGDFSDLQGENAKAGLADYQKNILAAKNDAIANAPNQRVRAALSGAINYQVSRYLHDGILHAKSEYTKYARQSLLTSADTYATTAMQAFVGDRADVFDHDLQEGAAKYLALGRAEGLPDGGVSLAAKYRGEVVTQAVKLAIDSGDPAKARGVLDRYKDQIDSGGLVAAEGALRSIELKVDSSAVVAHSTKPVPASQAPLPVIEHSWKGFSAERKAELLAKGYEAPANEKDPPVISKLRPTPTRPLSAIPEGAGKGIAQASLGQDPVALSKAWSDATSGPGALGLQSYFKNIPKDVEIAQARNFEKHPELWKSVPEKIAGFDVRKPLQEASAKLLKDNPIQVGAGHTAAAPVTAGGVDEFSRRRNAISSIEGNYNSIGPTVNGGNGIGRYQVMSYNVGDWTEQALGKRMTPEEFRADHAAQDAVFDKIFGGYVQKYGLAGAARTWFTGSPTGHGSDVNISSGTYVRRFMAAYTSRAVGSFGEGAPSRASMAMAPKSLAVSRVLAATQGNIALRNASMAELNRQYTDWNTMNAAQQTELRQNVPKMISDAESGEADLNDLTSKFPYDDIRNYMDPDKGEAWIKEFDAAKQVGGMISAMKWSSPEELQQAQVDLANGKGPIFDLASGQSDDPTETYRLASMGSKRLAKELETRQKMLVGPEADPAKFVRTNPAVFSAWQAYSTAKDPASFAKYAIASMTVQKQLGVDGSYAHVFTRDQALIAAKNIMSGTGAAKERINALARDVGPDAWPHIYRDLVTLGKLPLTYQALNVLSGEDARTMEMALSENAKEPGKDWSFRLGHGDAKAGSLKKEGIDQAISNDTNLLAYENSLRQSAISEQDINGVADQVRLLAYGNQYFKNDAAAAGNSVKAFVGQFDYLSPGGARVPISVMPTIKQNAATLLSSIDNQILMPEWVGQPNYPSRETYLSTLKSGAEWVTAASGDRLYLRKPGSMLANMPPGEKAFGSLSAAAEDPWVRGLNGEPVSVMFGGNEPYANFEVPQAAAPAPVEAPRTPITSETEPGGSEEGDDFLSASAKNSIQIYRNSLIQSGSMKPEEIEQSVKEYSDRFRHGQPMPGGNTKVKVRG